MSSLLTVGSTLALQPMTTAQTLVLLSSLSLVSYIFEWVEVLCTLYEVSVYSNIAKVQTLQEVLIQELVVKIQYLILIRQHLRRPSDHSILYNMDFGYII